ncbi:MAG: hypothetical protein RL492_778 [Verrucomicrobiota bacterium]|jgi:TPR repeat protein
MIKALLGVLALAVFPAQAATVVGQVVVPGGEPAAAAEQGKALDALKANANRGAMVDQYTLAELYLRGKTVPRDLVQAARWYRKAAYQGHADAQYKTFVCLNFGLGVPEDKLEAFSWLQKAVAQGHPRAHHSTGIVYEFGDCGQARDLAAAVKYYQKASDLADPDGTKSLATCYQMGIGVPADMRKALELYQKAADLGQPVAQVILAGFYLEGKQFPRDPMRGFELAQKSAVAGLGRGQFTLGVLYYQGLGTPRDLSQAVSWYRKAVESGEVSALYNLGYCYAVGEGVAVDKAEAYAHWTLAAESMPQVKDSLRRLTNSLSASELAAGKTRYAALRATVESRRIDTLLVGY